MSNSTIRDFEASRRTPISNNLDAISRTLEEAGIIFTSDPAGTMGIAGKARGNVPRASVIAEKDRPDRKRKPKTIKKRR